MNLKQLISTFLLSALCFSSLLGAERVRLPDGTPVRVRLKADLVAESAQQGNRVDFEVSQPVVVGGVVVIPEGAVAWGAVQDAKPGKFVKFDIEGVRLPNLVHVKLRSIRAKTKNPGKDQIKIETEFGGGVGARRGSEFTAYVDEEVEAEGLAAQPAPKPAPLPREEKAPALTAAPAEVSVPSATPAPAPAPAEVKAPASKPAPAPAETKMPAPEPTAQPAPTPSVAPAAPTPASIPPEAAATNEPVTVECFSEPSGADILIDGDFVGNTPSILKVKPTSHQLELQLDGYKSISEVLNLSGTAGIRTIRRTLEKKE